MNCLTKLRGFRAWDAAALAALPYMVGLPFVGVQNALFGPSDRLLSLVTAHVNLSADAFTAVLMAAYCLLLAVMLYVGDRFLRRFSHLHGRAGE